MHNYDTLIKDFVQYKKLLGYKYETEFVVLNRIKKYLIKNNINNITRETTENYARINPNLSTNTISRDMRVFREFCNYLKTQKDIDCYQIPKNIYTNNNNFRPYIFSHAEIKTLYSNLNIINNNFNYEYYAQNALPLIIKILYQTGMRISEVLNLKLEDYDFELSIFNLKFTKNSYDRIVAIPETLNNEISKYYNKFYYNKTKELLFNLKYGVVNNYFKKVLKNSNIHCCDKGPRIHDLRHTYIVHNIEKLINDNENLNAFLPILQAQVGHQSLESLSYYFHITNDILNIVNKTSEEQLGYLIPGGDENNG